MVKRPTSPYEREETTGESMFSHLIAVTRALNRSLLNDLSLWAIDGMDGEFVRSLADTDLVCSHWRCREDADSLRRTLNRLVADSRMPVDFCVTAEPPRHKKLLISDMDSTIIGQECIDELADLVGLRPQISAITERAMRGELDFDGALRTRVAMLKGLSLTDLERCHTQRVTLNPGARCLVRTMRENGAYTVLVSGGFSVFTQRVAVQAGFDADYANTLLFYNKALTGAVAEPILGRAAKLARMQLEATRLGLGLDDCLALGDGANDLGMITAAGLGLAYRAKPIVSAQAHAHIQHTDLRAALLFQGFSESEFIVD